MKKFFLMLLALMLALTTLTAFAEEDGPSAEANELADVVLLDGFITDVLDDSLLLLTKDGLAVEALLNEDTIFEGKNAAIGDYVQIVYNGIMTRSLPAKITAMAVRNHMLMGVVSDLAETGFTLTFGEEIYQVSADAALLGRELSRFTTSANYMLNSGLGILFLVAGAVALVWKGNDFLLLLSAVFAEKAEAVPVLLCAVVCLLVSMNDMAAPSVSLEGKSLWLAQSLPVTAWQVIRAKLRMHLLLTGIPVALCCVCIAIVCPFTVAQTALVLAVTVLFTGMLRGSFRVTAA